VLDEETAALENGLTMLATVGATAPFVGLFGTVWGVYHALITIGMTGSGMLDKVAGPVGEALIMTGIGLAVALPAVMGYNWLTRANRVLTGQARRLRLRAADLPVDRPRPAGPHAARRRRRAQRRQVSGRDLMAFGSFDRKNASQPMAEINMVPLIDVVLVLLVIFIVTAPLMTHAVKLDLPKASSNADIQKPEKIEFAIDGSGALFWNAQRITREEAAAKFLGSGQETAAARGLPASRSGRRLPLRRRDPGRRLQGRLEQGRLR
jgi:biopolymer transport protein ExbD